MRKSSVRILIALFMVLVLTAGLVGTAQAVVVDRGGTLPAGQTVDDDLLLGGYTVRMDGTVNGTLIAAGSTVTVNGTVKGDALLFAQNITVGPQAVIEGNLFVGAADVVIQGTVGGSVFGGSAALNLGESASVGYNLYYGGYSLDTSAGSKVARDISAGVYQAGIAGSSRNLNLAGVAFDISGQLSGDATIYLGEPSQAGGAYFQGFPNSNFPNIASRQPGLRLAPSARISGKLTYTSPTSQQSGFQSTPAGGIVFQTPVPRQSNPRNQPITVFQDFSSFGAGLWIWSLLRNMVELVLLGLLAAGLFGGLFRRSVDAVRQKPLQSAGIGLLALAVALVAAPLVAILLVLLAIFFGLLTLFDFVGILLSLGFTLLGLALVVFVIALFWAGRLVLSYIIGEWILRKLNSPAAANRFWPVVLGAVVFALLEAIPIIGWLVSFVVALVGVGMFYYTLRKRLAEA